MEAARVAALRGHEVVLFEKEKELGGGLRYACKAINRGELEQVIRYLSNQIRKVGVKVQLGQEVDKEAIYKMKPDAVVVAAGQRLTGLHPGDREGQCPYLPRHLRRKGQSLEESGGDGGKLIGCEAAEYISDKGAEVILVEPTAALCTDAGTRTKWLLMERLEKNPKIDKRVKTNVEKIDRDSVVLNKDGKLEEVRGVDMIVLAMAVYRTIRWRRVEEGVEDSEVYTVGDCEMPRKMTEAIYEGFMAGQRI